MIELKLCPWCGSTDVVMEYEMVTGTYAFRCRGCHTVVWQYYSIEDEAIEAWNRRVE